VAVVATLSKGYDLKYIWMHVDRGRAKDAAGYYIQASETGGEPPGRWWGPGARALGFEPGQTVERQPYDLLFGERKAPRRHSARPPARQRPQSRRPIRPALGHSAAARSAGRYEQSGRGTADAAPCRCLALGTCPRGHQDEEVPALAGTTQDGG
jgi:hypothetical protein